MATSCPDLLLRGGRLVMKPLLEGYRVVSTLGRGAASTIYHVIEKASGRDFALKRVIRNGPDDDRFIEQVETEFQVTSKVDHPYIRKSLAIHRVREWMKTREVMLLMEYVDGYSLETKRPPRMDIFLGIFKRVAEGIHAVHRAGFLHTDLKPLNVLWTRKGMVKVIDFGQACPVGHRKDRIQGTPDFIAPEQVKKAVLMPPTDIFNLGASMYWILTGQHFPTELPHHKLGGGGEAHHVHVQRTALTPRQINPKIPLALSQLVMDCCDASPSARPADMGVVQKRLASIQALWRKRHSAVRERKHAAEGPGHAGHSS